MAGGMGLSYDDLIGEAGGLYSAMMHTCKHYSQLTDAQRDGTPFLAISLPTLAHFGVAQGHPVKLLNVPASLPDLRDNDQTLSSLFTLVHT